jgi:hypothetical protein
MYRLAKWAYRKGVEAERSRIKKLIAEYRQEKPDKSKNNSFRMEVWEEANYELKKLIDPYHGINYMPNEKIARIEDESL